MVGFFRTCYPSYVPGQTLETPALWGAIAEQWGRGRVRLRLAAPRWNPTPATAARSWAEAAHRLSGRRGDHLRAVKPSSDRQPASVIRRQANSIFKPRSSTVSTCTVASPLWTRSAIVSSLNPRVSKAFTSRPRGALASTLSTWRCLSVRLWFVGSVTISAPHHGVDGLPARRGEAIAESFASDCRVPNAGKSFPPEFGPSCSKRRAPPGDHHSSGNIARSTARPRPVRASRPSASRTTKPLTVMPVIVSPGTPVGSSGAVPTRRQAAARLRRIDHHRSDAGQPAGRRVHPHTRSPAGAARGSRHLTSHSRHSRRTHYSHRTRRSQRNRRTAQRPHWLAGVPGFEPGNGGIKIHS